MWRQVTLVFADSGRAVSTCCPHQDHATVADLIRCGGRSAFLIQSENVKFDIVSCQAQPLEGLEFFKDVELSEEPIFPCYVVEICTRKTDVPKGSGLAADVEKKDTEGVKRPISLRDVPELPFSDVTIFVGKENVRSNSGYLSVYSAYFGQAFAGMSCSTRQMSLTLSGVTPSEVAQFLIAIYPNPTNVDVSNVVTLAKLARRFVAPSLTDRCVAFLSSDRLPLWERIYIAGTLDKLQAFRELSEELVRLMLPVDHAVVRMQDDF